MGSIAVRINKDMVIFVDRKSQIPAAKRKYAKYTDDYADGSEVDEDSIYMKDRHDRPEDDT